MQINGLGAPIRNVADKTLRTTGEFEKGQLQVATLISLPGK